MYDNGLLEYYGSLPSPDGFLDISSLGIIKSRDKYRGAGVNKVAGKRYYVKNVFSKDINYSRKFNLDAEILLSQIYKKAGLSTAIYLPATSQGKTFLISNDIASQNVLPAVSHLYPLFGTEIGSKSYLRTLPFLIKNRNELEIDPKLILSSQAMQQQTIMRVLDVASHNDDRHYANFFYDISRQEKVEAHQEENRPAKELQDVFSSIDEYSNPSDAVFNLSGQQEIMDYYRSFRADGVVSIDYGASGDIFLALSRGEVSIAEQTDYENEFSSSNLTPKEFKQEIVENEQFAEIINKKELAETIGSLNPSGIAGDILRLTGYEIDGQVVDILSKSYDDMAETLLL